MSSNKGKPNVCEPVQPTQPEEPNCNPPPEPIVCPQKEEKPKEQCPTTPEDKKEKDTCTPPVKEDKKGKEKEDKGKGKGKDDQKGKGKEDKCEAPKEDKKQDQCEVPNSEKKDSENACNTMQNFQAQSCQPSIVVQCPGQGQQAEQGQQGQQGQGGNQQVNPPGVCKREQAMMALMEEQAKPPPLTINVKVGVPGKACEDKSEKKDQSNRSCSPSKENGKKGDRKKS